jgi:hypothetical protein
MGIDVVPGVGVGTELLSRLLLLGLLYHFRPS